MIAIDGTQKFFRNGKWCEEALHRKVGKNETKHEQYYVYVLESVLMLDNGIVLPLMTEFLENKDYEISEGDSEEKQKQDCETKSFKRLAKRLKIVFRNITITVVLDGIYAICPSFRKIINYSKINSWL